MPWLQRPDTIMYWYYEGDKGLPPLLMIHGLGAPPELSFFSLIPSLKKTYRLILPSMRGQGNNLREGKADPRSLFSIRYPEMVVEDLIALLDTLSIGSASVVGYSLGGTVALLLAALQPMRISKLVLLSAAVKINPGPMLTIATLLSRPGLLPHVPDEVPVWLRQIIRYYNEKYILMGEAEVMSVRQGFLDTWIESIKRNIKKVKAKTLIVHGAKDEIVPVDASLYIHQNIKNSVLHIIPNVTHGLHNENTNVSLQISQWIQHFLKE
ncbi:MAG: alpha/beta fold hydrolase [Candidatus Ranarchaeia archaeon]